ncbi:hypothetical protein ACFWPA_03685 [Rhodococcus sp. NPDC058505]|uniref:hypothetical protein n=1 Tax=Rhodococcus sp. NPDC058505 TaxID=3346531 RepID=UPI00365CE85F
MNRQQLADAHRGVRLLTGHLRGEGESLDSAISAGRYSEAEAEAMADPLVNVAIILARQLRAALDVEIGVALQRARALTKPELSEYSRLASALIATVISGEHPEPIEVGPRVVAVGAQEIAAGAAKALADHLGEHPNAVVARLRRQLQEQGEGVQLSDKDGVELQSAKYAEDSEMRQSRLDTALALVKEINNGAAVPIHNRGVDLHERNEIVGRDCYEGLSRIAVTAAALGYGVVQLVGVNNHYPAYALLRQLVETEFVLWKFGHDPSTIPGWLNSDRDERERTWKPSKIYRNADNDYRQKDYSGHCEMGGHPTPLGTLIASGERSAVAEASVLGDLIGHLRDSWGHIVSTADALDSKWIQSEPCVSIDARQRVADAHAKWSRIDKYGYSVSYFADPL